MKKGRTVFIIGSLKRICSLLIGLTIIVTMFSCKGRGSSKSGTADADTGAYLTPQMVSVQGGRFKMGDNRRDEQEEKPEHM